MGFQDLPQEVVDHIVDNISDDKLLRDPRDRRAYSACSLVSRTFVARCQMWLFFYVRPYNPELRPPSRKSIGPLTEQLTRFPSHLSKHVKRIDHHADGICWRHPYIGMFSTSRWNSIHILLEACTELVELKLFGCDLSESLKYPEGTPLSHSSVRSLGLVNCDTRLSQLLSLLSRFPSMHTFTLELTLEHSIWMTETIAPVAFPNVRTLELVRALEPPYLLANQLCHSFPAVQQLIIEDLPENMMYSVPAFVPAFSRILHHLHLKFLPSWVPGTFCM